MYEVPEAKATMTMVKVMRNNKESFNMWFIDKIIGPKYFEAMPT